jgi:hypothetical protein
MTVKELQALLCGSAGAAVENIGSLRVAGEGIPRVFCKRVRKPLAAKELLKYSFLKSAQGIGNEEFSFGVFCKRAMRAEQVVCRIWVEGLKGDFNAESTEKRSWSENRRECERNIRHGSRILTCCKEDNKKL